MKPGFAFIQRFLRDCAGITIDNEKLYLIEHRLQPILQQEKFAGLDDLARSLQGNEQSELARSVVETLTINETSFFRDRGMFSALADTILPRFIEARQQTRHLRIWCSACSTGQEPYSVAMIIDEYSRKLSGWHIEIIATDLSRPVIETARRGIYSQFEVQRGLPVAMLLRYFQRAGDSWQISDYLRAKVTFKTQNLMKSDREQVPYDIILCRNVLIYFDVATKRRVLENLSGCIAHDGRLVLGAAESVVGLNANFRADGTQNFVFMKDNPASLVNNRDRSIGPTFRIRA